MASKKKLLTSVVALGTAAALTLGGTFAWQSINQTVVNEGSNIVNPGGRLHDDFDGTNKDVYVENFADEDIFARVRLKEFFEIVMNYGIDGAETVIPMIGTKTEKKDSEGNTVTNDDGKTLYNYNYVTFKDYTAGYSVDAGIVDEESWWHWDMGGDTVFMPTFNKNKDSLVADVNGEYKFDTGVITSEDVEGGQYTEMATYEEGDTEEGQAIYDADTNKLDEVGNDFDNLDQYVTDGSIKLVTEEHTAKATPSGSLMSMADWLAAVEADGYVEGYDTCWVYDEDGWVYWSAPIKAGEATGLLLDGIQLNQVMDDSWYYAIEVEGQFVTADDVGKDDNTGFYQEEDEAPTTDAETLLEMIGVGQEEDNGPVLKMHSSSDYNSTGYIRATAGEAFRLQTSSGSTPSGEGMYIFTHGGNNFLDEDTDYTYEDGYLTILVDSDKKYYLNSYGSYLLVQADNCTGAILLEDDGDLTVGSGDTPDCTLAAVGQGVTIRNAEGDAPEADGVSLRQDAMSYDESTEHYDYADGVLTITNADLVGKRVQVITNDGSGWLIVTAGSTSGGNESTGGGTDRHGRGRHPRG